MWVWKTDWCDFAGLFVSHTQNKQMRFQNRDFTRTFIPSHNKRLHEICSSSFITGEMGSTHGRVSPEKPDTPILIAKKSIWRGEKKKRKKKTSANVSCQTMAAAWDEPLIKMLLSLSLEWNCPCLHDSRALLELSPATKPHQYKESLLSRRIIGEKHKPLCNNKKNNNMKAFFFFFFANHLKHESKCQSNLSQLHGKTRKATFVVP